MPDNDLEYKVAPTEFKAAGDKGEYEGHFSIFSNIDDGGDIMWPGAFSKTLAENSRRVKVFYAHDWEKLIGPAPEVLQEDARGLFAKGRLTLDSFWGKEVWALMKDGALTEGSIGYWAVKYDFADEGRIRNLREVKLVEVSPVPLGMNALTSIRAVKAAAFRALKAAIPPKEMPKAAADTPWDSSEVLKELSGARQLRLVHAWMDPEGDPDAKGSYKLPHHLPTGEVVWNGVKAAGAALMGARGGVELPETDIAGVKAHLAKHYAQFDQTCPWEKAAGLDTHLATLAWVTGELKVGRVLSSANKDTVQSAIDALQQALDALNELLAAADPNAPQDDGGKRAQSALLLLKRLRAAELALALR